MNRTASRAALTVASVYGYFLLFAQFAFVELVRAAGADTRGERILLGSMALAGVASGFFAARLGPSSTMIRAHWLPPPWPRAWPCFPQACPCSA